jgi:VIT1/CCC1 family predicted Fe2+/Mn2+ transporter
MECARKEAFINKNDSQGREREKMKTSSKLLIAGSIISSLILAHGLTFAFFIYGVFCPQSCSLIGFLSGSGLQTLIVVGLIPLALSLLYWFSNRREEELEEKGIIEADNAK